MRRPVFILLVALTGVAICNPVGRQVGISADVEVTSINTDHPFEALPEVGEEQQTILKVNEAPTEANEAQTEVTEAQNVANESETEANVAFIADADAGEAQEEVIAAQSHQLGETEREVTETQTETNKADEALTESTVRGNEVESQNLFNFNTGETQSEPIEAQSEVDEALTEKRNAQTVANEGVIDASVNAAEVRNKDQTEVSEGHTEASLAETEFSTEANEAETVALENVGEDVRAASEGSQLDPQASNNLPEILHPQRNADQEETTAVVEANELVTEGNESVTEVSDVVGQISQGVVEEREAVTEENDVVTEGNDAVAEGVTVRSDEAEAMAERNVAETEKREVVNEGNEDVPESATDANEAATEEPVKDVDANAPSKDSESSAGVLKEEAQSDQPRDAVQVSVNEETFPKENTQPAVNTEDENYWLNMNKERPQTTHAETAPSEDAKDPANTFTTTYIASGDGQDGEEEGEVDGRSFF